MQTADLERLAAILVSADGSDLHLKVGSVPRVRVNSQLRRLEDEGTLGPQDTESVARSLMDEEMGRRFDELGEVDLAAEIGASGRFRVNVFRQRGTVALVMRHVRTSIADASALGLPGVVENLADQPRGLVLVTGPTGSGKTTTLAAMIDRINRTRECHIVTIEDPIEFMHSDILASINQREVGFDTLGFPGALRAALRQDPDVILLGEMRDQDTVQTALAAAETGHLVLSTLHTIDVSETVNRTVDLFPPHQQSQVRTTLAGSLRGILCQRLVPTADGVGRVPAVETMVANGRIRQCILDPKQTSAIHDIIAEGDFYGMQTFDQSLVDLLARGVVSMEDAMEAASNPHDLRVELERRGLVATGAAAVG